VLRHSSCTLLCCAALVSSVACGSKKQPPKPRPPTSDAAVTVNNKPRLVVLIVVDQLPSWSFDKQHTFMKSGIGRLLRGGTFYPRAEYPYAITYTAPGHVALATGAPPAVSGILANGWYQRSLGRSVSAVADKEHPIMLVNPAGDTAKNKRKRAYGASAARLKVTGVGDWLRAQTDGKGKAIAVSLKDRAANFVLGQRPNLAIWYDAGQAAMTTSSWYAKQPPPWLLDLAKKKPVSANFNYVWKLASPELTARITGNPDDAPGEGGIYGLTNTFPHSLAKASAAAALRATPVGPLITTQTAIAAVHGEQLGKDDIPDLLAVSYSSHDYAGHTWGQESWERFDLLLHIDKQIGVLLDELDRVVGKDRYTVVLTSDHGVTRVVEQSKQHKRAAHRITTDALMIPLTKACEGVLGKGKWIAAGSASMVYMTAEFHKLPSPRKDKALAAMVAALKAVKGIAYAKRTDQLAGNCATRRGIDALVCRSLAPNESGDIFVAVAPNSIFSGEYKTGTTHGSPNPDDRFVPIIVHTPGGKARVVKGPVSTLRIAPTLARMLDIKPAKTAPAPALVP